MYRSFFSRVFAFLLLCLLPSSALLAADSGDDLDLFFDQNELVEAASRYPKPISQVAENVTIITAAEIDPLHAHSVGQVLQEIPGLYVTSAGQDFSTSSPIITQGAAAERTLVLIDGVRYNNASGGTAELNGLPVGIIKRIEVIKGPVSSVWGSSLGGVINILTKDTGSTAKPTGRVSTSVAEANSVEANGQVAGKVGIVGYYFYGAHQETDGLWRDRYFDNKPVYGKLKVDLPGDMSFGLTTGHSNAEYKTLDIPLADVTEWIVNRNTFATLYFDAPLANGFNLHLSLKHFSQDFQRENDSLGLGASPKGTFLWKDRFSESTVSLAGNLLWQGLRNSAVLGVESSRSELDYTADWAAWSIFTVFPEVREERRGVFANATLNWGKISLSPGLRHDYNSNTEDSLSPSLGVTYQLRDDTVIRGTVARGFNTPNLSMLFGSIGNPDLLPEEIWTYQAGLESAAVSNLRLSAVAFLHRVKNNWSSNSGLWANGGRVRRKGIEFEADTVPWRHFSISAKASFVSRDDQDYENDDMYAANLVFLYDNPSVVTARLGGRYIWWNKFYDVDSPNHDTFTWDLSLNRELYSSDNLTAEVFGVARNLFNGSQYWDIDYQNAERWLEGGLTLRF